MAIISASAPRGARFSWLNNNPHTPPLPQLPIPSRRTSKLNFRSKTFARYAQTQQDLFSSRLQDSIEILPKLVEDIVQTSINTGPRGALRLAQGIQAFLGVGGVWLADVSKDLDTELNSATARDTTTNATAVSANVVVDERQMNSPFLDVKVSEVVGKDDYKYLESDGEVQSRNHKRVVAARGKANSERNGVDFDSDEENNGNGEGGEEEDQEPFDWEKEMRKRVKEIEERRELEKKAEELQSRILDDNSLEEKEESEEEKKERVRKELNKVAMEQAERRATAELMFELGQKAYGKGMYGRAIEFLEASLTIIPRSTLFGGEIQIWLAMAYEANNRHADCIALYKQLEMKHPSVSIQRQAANLRYILQAPKLKISQEEMVTIPLIGSTYDRL
ncbi:unnamed protein product [Dovyalis caffra]|uniref:Tetratricopeptide repeat-like superfamily protein n=1 Tax=Dovyalis caffra TaxID=77055 RepID=A0AAV1RWS5_9ROSI|nr:unnamed protein product [Dovyalis caffra]